MTLRALARQLKVNESKIRKAVESGRLELSVGWDAKGRPMILDVALARREWRDNRDPAKARP